MKHLGTKTSMVTGMNGIMAGPLHYMAAKMFAKEYDESIRIRREKANAPIKVKGPKPIFTDNEILEMRRLHEFCGVSRKELTSRFGADYDALNRILGYITRSKLIPKNSGSYLN